MKKKYLITIIVVIAVIASGVAYALLRSPTASTPKAIQNKKEANKENTKDKSKVFDKNRYSLDTPGSLWWIVGKKRPLPDGYTPDNLVTPNVTLNPAKSADENKLRQDAATALEQLFAGAKQEGIDYMLASGFRSTQLQTTYYNNYVKTSGQAEADRYSARPGTSEHQTGLALDVSSADRVHYLDQAFGSDPGGIWLAAHAHEYGFIIRYPENKESLTGYMYEPWHIRYVGKELATELLNKKLTMEEFFNVSN